MGFRSFQMEWLGIYLDMTQQISATLLPCRVNLEDMGSVCLSVCFLGANIVQGRNRDREVCSERKIIQTSKSSLLCAPQGFNTLRELLFVVSSFFGIYLPL